MSPRSIRRAAERREKKLARKAAQDSNSQFITTPEPSREISEAQLAANRQNAQVSTGPTSSEGKAKSSLNAVKTGLTGRTVLLPTDDAAAYQYHVSEFEKEYQPVGPRECALVQSIADTFWRLDRIRSLEWAIFAKGHTEFAENFAHEDPSARPALIDLHTFLTYEKQIRNLHLQEARLQRRREKDTAELRQVQQERNSREAEALEAESRLDPATRRASHSQNGFEFSNCPQNITDPAETDSVPSRAQWSYSAHALESQSFPRADREAAS
jgi:hypothetical protein